ncbi:MAG: hypothetical protein MR888_08490 [Clostridiales bacterium]|nr:hypothetical protein [Clostridiales bacterium]
MFELPSIDFSELNCSSEIETVGIEDANDLVKPAITALIKDGIQRQVRACNLSKRAADELVEAFGNEGFAIALDSDIQPDIAVLPTSFSPTTSQDENEDNPDANYTAEQQKALNYASWAIEALDFSACPPSADTKPMYPLNLLNAIFGERGEYHFHSPELMSIMCAQFDDVLGTLAPTEEKVLRAIYQDGKTEDDLICALGLQNNEVAAWAMHETINAKAGRALRKLRHPSRSRRIRDFLCIISYLENVDDATLDDIRNSCLYEKKLSWENKLNGESETLDWDTCKIGHCFRLLFDVDTLPANLILNKDDFGWCQWPVGLLMGSTSEPFFPNCPEASIHKAFFSANAVRPHYLLAVKQSSDDVKSFALFGFSDGNLSRVQIDAGILRNLYRIIEESHSDSENTENLRILYAAEQQYCELQLQQASDPREKEYYKMFLELIKSQRDALPKKYDKRLLEMTIEELDLGCRAFRALKRYGLNTVEDLVPMTEDDLIRVRNLGRKAAEEVFGKLRALGIELRKNGQEC